MDGLSWQEAVADVVVIVEVYGVDERSIRDAQNGDVARVLPSASAKRCYGPHGEALPDCLGTGRWVKSAWPLSYWWCQPACGVFDGMESSVRRVVIMDKPRPIEVLVALESHDGKGSLLLDGPG